MRRFLIVIAIVSTSIAVAVTGCDGSGDTGTDTRIDTTGERDGVVIIDIPWNTDARERDANHDSTTLDDAKTPPDGSDAEEIDTYIEPGMPGSPCSENEDCVTGFCIETLDGLECAKLCQTGEICGDGFSCTQVQAAPDTLYACVFQYPRLCLPCNTDSECQTTLVSGFTACVGGESGRFCGAPCSKDEDCPSEYVCSEVQAASGASVKQCVPRDGECECSQKAIERYAWTTCSYTNDFGSCSGKRTCLEDGLTGCSALQPELEVCDGDDNDCDDISDNIESRACLVSNNYGSCPGTTVCQNTKEICMGTPAAQESCNDIDDDCDSKTDEAGSLNCTTYYRDSDSDTYGREDESQCLCSPIMPFTATRAGDCYDTLASIKPGVPEACNGKDDNCDGQTDEENATSCITLYRDDDEDYYGKTADSKCLCQVTPPYSTNDPGDCNDSDSSINPGAIERCNSKDDNCDLTTDPEGAPGCSPFYYDYDGDGYGATGLPARCLCGPDYLSKYSVLSTGDCNDTVPQINPGKTEECGDSIDNDCDGQTDENGATGCVPRYRDEDNDGFGAGDSLCVCSAQPPLTAMVGGDCNDNSYAIKPSADEKCNDSIDNDCNGLTDEEGSADCTNYYYDNDRDNYGTGAPRCLCNPEGVYIATQPGDCADGDPARNPGVNEVCGNAIDEDCSGILNDEDADGCDDFFKDEDSDDYGDKDDSKCLCQASGDYQITVGGDCDDDNPDINPGVAEICTNGVDDNCNNSQNEENAEGCVPYYYDYDGDTYGVDSMPSRCLCEALQVDKYRALMGGDCNDTNAAIKPSATEVCEGVGYPAVDNDCDGYLNEENASGCIPYYYDSDYDGHGDSTKASKCFCTGGSVGLKYTSLVNNDCNDADNTIATGLQENCDDKDNNCNGYTDEEGASGCTNYFRDADGDDYGDPDDSKCLCGPDLLGGGYVSTDPTDCLDTNEDVHPGGKLCAYDGDCDGEYLDIGEECDDGNQVEWDGCTACVATEVLVNSTVTNSQDYPVATALTDGRFLVAFNTMTSSKGYNIGARYISATGTRLGSSDITVNAYVDNNQQYPTIATLSNGSALILWESYLQDGSGYGVFGQRLDSTGTKMGAEFQVNNTAGSDQRAPAVAAFNDDTFVAVWAGYGQDGSGNSIVARTMLANGLPDSTEFIVNQTTASDQDEPEIARLDGDAFAIAWRGLVDRGGVTDRDVFVRVYSSAGVAISDEILVNEYTTSDQQKVSIAALGADGFVVVWQSMGQDGDLGGIYGRLFTTDGAYDGSPFRINSTATGSQGDPSVAGLPDGRFLVSWWSDDQDESGLGVFGQRYLAGGTKTGSEFKGNSHTSGDQSMPHPAITANSLLLSWMSANQDGSQNGVFARLFAW